MSPIISGGSGSGSGSTDGWIASSDSFVFASSTTFTIAGVNRTAIYTPGTRIKLTNSTVKYFVVVSSAFSTDTTVTVTGGSDYTLANAAITLPSYSYVSNPQGFPGWFNWTPSPTGYTGSPTVFARFTVLGRLCTAYIDVTGTSNATTLTFTLPIAVGAGQTDGPILLISFLKDNTVTLNAPGRVALPGSGSTATCSKDMSGTAWSASGTKQILTEFAYEI